jgi:regulator of protease activity HflC (stomatin/prohibitin superfamily)
MERRNSSLLAGTALAVLLLGAVGITSCASCTLIEPGHVGIRVERAGANRGVQDLPVVSGWVAFNPVSETVIEFPVTVQTAVWTANRDEGRPLDESITFSSREGVSVSADVALSYHVESRHAGRLYTRFRTTDLDTLTHGYVRNLVRDGLNEEACQMPIEQIYGPGKTAMLERTLRNVQTRMGHDGFVDDQLSFQGALRLPPNVVDAINRAMQATQDAVAAQNRVAQVEAEARQRVAAAEGEANAARASAQGDADALLIRTRADAANREAMATAEANANRTIAASLTPPVIEMRRIERWNGVLPTVQGGGTPLISLGH